MARAVEEWALGQALMDIGSGSSVWSPARSRRFFPYLRKSLEQTHASPMTPPPTTATTSTATTISMRHHLPPTIEPLWISTRPTPERHRARSGSLRVLADAGEVVPSASLEPAPERGPRQRALVFGCARTLQSRQDVQLQPPRRCGGIDTLAKGDESDAEGLEFIERGFSGLTRAPCLDYV